MHAFMNRLKKDQTGLTLIELIVVVAIIGVLAWLITPRVLEALGKSKTASMDNFANEIAAAMERYAGDPDLGNGEYPADTNDDIASLAAELNMAASKTDGFLDWGAAGSTDPLAYELGTTATGSMTNAYCIFLLSWDASENRFISDGGVFDNATDAQNASIAITDGVAGTGLACPTAPE